MDITLHNATETKRAYADIVGEGISGRADFIEYQIGAGKIVHVLVKIKGDPSILRPGNHGCHIHEKGICEPPFQSAGGHFDPGEFGNSDPDANHPYHMGDLPNLIVKDSGEGELEWLADRFSLTEGPACILTEEGTCLMVHGNADGCHPGPSKSGVSGGPRAACGVIREVK